MSDDREDLVKRLRAWQARPRNTAMIVDAAALIEEAAVALARPATVGEDGREPISGAMVVAAQRKIDELTGKQLALSVSETLLVIEAALAVRAPTIPPDAAGLVKKARRYVAGASYYCPKAAIDLINELVDTITRTDPNAVAREWHDISNAPRDGTSILIFSRGKMYVATFGWHEDIGDVWLDGDRTHRNVIYWQPLPDAPRLAALTEEKKP